MIVAQFCMHTLGLVSYYFIGYNYACVVIFG